MEVIIYICLALLLSFCILAAMLQSLLKSAIFLAFASATLGVILFVLGAPWAAVIEVSACSGLVTVIFISAISLSRIKKEEVQKLYADKKQMKYLPYILIIAGIVIIVAALAGSVALPGTAVESTEDFREVFWNSRQADILGQIVSILIGGIAVYVLMRESKD